MDDPPEVDGAEAEPQEGADDRPPASRELAPQPPQPSTDERGGEDGGASQQ